MSATPRSLRSEFDDVVATFDGLEEGEIGNIVDAQWWSPHELATGMSLSSWDLPTIARAAVAALTRTSGGPGDQSPAV